MSTDDSGIAGSSPQHPHSAATFVSVSLTLYFGCLSTLVPFGKMTQHGLFILVLTYLSLGLCFQYSPGLEHMVSLGSRFPSSSGSWNPTQHNPHLSEDQDRMAARGLWPRNVLFRPELGWGEWGWVMQVIGRILSVFYIIFILLLHLYLVYDH